MSITQVIVLALGIGSGAFIVSLAQVSKPLRLLVLTRSKPGAPRAKAWKWLFDLLNCPYCVSMWMSLAAVAIYHPVPLRYYWPVGYVTVSLAVSSAAMLAVFVIRRALGK